MPWPLVRLLAPLRRAWHGLRAPFVCHLPPLGYVCPRCQADLGDGIVMHPSFTAYAGTVYPVPGTPQTTIIEGLQCCPYCHATWPITIGV